MLHGRDCSLDNYCKVIEKVNKRAGGKPISLRFNFLLKK